MTGDPWYVLGCRDENQAHDIARQIREKSARIEVHLAHDTEGSWEVRWRGVGADAVVNAILRARVPITMPGVTPGEA